MNLIEKLNYLKLQYKMILPIEYEKFVQSIQFFDYSDSKIKANGVEIELNHFLIVDEENPSRDILRWYSFAEKGRRDYLTIAMGYGHEEIAIKVKDADNGGVYYIDQTEEVIIVKLFDNFDEFKKQLTLISEEN